MDANDSIEEQGNFFMRDSAHTAMGQPAMEQDHLLNLINMLHDLQATLIFTRKESLLMVTFIMLSLMESNMFSRFTVESEER